MFSRAAKSVVKSVGSHRIYTGEKNFKIALIGGAREISQTLSQLLRNNVKPNVLALYDVAAVNKPFYNFYHEQPFKSIPSEMSTMRKKSCLEEGNRSNTVINSTRQTDNNNHQGNNGRNQTEKLVEALYRLPIAEEVPALNSPLVPIEELMSKPQPENLTVKISKSEIIAERRESSSSSMTSAVKITESEKPIEFNRIQANRDFLSIINSYQQFTEINFVKDFQQDFNSTVNHKDCFAFSFLHNHFVTHLCYCKQCDKFEESKLLYDANDDYFPQGEEYEDEIGTDEYQLDKKMKKPSKELPIVDDEYDNFQPMMLFENNKYVNGGPLTRFITHVHFSSIEELTEPNRIMLMLEKVSNKDAVEKLQTLIEKVAELKRRVFRSKRKAPKIEATDGKNEKKIINENKDNESMKIETTNQ